MNLPADDPRADRPRPAAVRATVVVLLFLGTMALAGGAEMIAFPHGGPFLPAAWLDRIPLVDTYLVPGLVLVTLFGLGSLVAATGVLLRPDWRLLRPVGRVTGQHWSWVLTVLIGVAFTVWMVLDLVLLTVPVAVGEADGVTTGLANAIAHGAFGVVAAALLVLPHTEGVRRHLDSGEGRGRR